MIKKADLIELVQGITAGTKVQAQQIVESIFTAISDEMAKGEVAEIPGFGKFIGKWQEEREARVVATGKMTTVPAKYVPKMKFSQTLKDKLKAAKKQ